MLIGIDASRAFVSQRTGVENYSWHIIKQLSLIKTPHHFRLYLRPGQTANFPLPHSWQIKVLPWPRFFTQIGLALETIIHPPTVLFIPAHTLPLLTKLFRPQVKIVVTLHGWEAGYLPKAYALRSRFWLLESTRWAIKFADHLIAVSQNTRQDLIIKLHCDPQKISVIYEGVDLTRFQKPSTKSRVVREGNPSWVALSEYILFVGTLQPRKNLNRLIKAFAQLLSLKPNLNLVIVGKKGWNFSTTLSLPQRLGISNHVKFLEYVSDQDLTTLYYGASVFCLPSLAEGFGLPVLEAMAAGVPVVASNTTALPEVVGNAGILINPLEVQSINQGLQIALGSPTPPDRGVVLPQGLVTGKNLPHALKLRGAQRIKQFTWEKAADSTLRILLKNNY